MMSLSYHPSVLPVHSVLLSRDTDTNVIIESCCQVSHTSLPCLHTEVKQSRVAECCDLHISAQKLSYSSRFAVAMIPLGKLNLAVLHIVTGQNLGSIGQWKK